MAYPLPTPVPVRTGPSAYFRLALLGLFVGVLLVRVVYVSLFANDLPYWDQWDAAIDTMLRPWMDGSWRPGSLFDAHNEHRIALARLLTLAVFKLNSDRWDNLVEAYVNAVLYAAIYAMLCAFLCRREADQWVRAATLIFFFAVAVLPFGWENALVGIQSAFLLMMIGAIAMIALVARRPPTAGTLVLLCLLGAASLFTIASGVLSCVAVVAALLLRHWHDRVPTGFIAAVLLGMALLTAAGLALIPDLPGGDPLKAAGIAELLGAALVIPMWPLQPLLGSESFPIGIRLAFALVLWAPSLAWLARFARLRKADDAEIFAGGVIAWVALQAIAIAHSRGHGMTVLASRYMDIAAIGLLVNAWFAIRMVSRSRTSALIAWPRYAIAIAFLSVAVWGLAVRTPTDAQQMRSRHQLVLLQRENVVDYTRTGNFAHLRQPRLGIPYRNPSGLRHFLDNPVIRAMLPLSIRPPPAASPSQPGGARGSDAKGSPELATATPDESGRLSVVAQRMQGAIRNLIRVEYPETVSAVRLASTALGGAMQTPSVCVLEAINDVPMSESTNVNSGSAVKLSGWVIGSDRKAPAEFTLVLKGANAQVPNLYGLNAATGVARPDVAKWVRSEGAATAGFSANFKLSNLAHGIYRILTRVQGPDGSELCDTQRYVVIDGITATRMDSAALDLATQTDSICVLETINGLPAAPSTSVRRGSAVNLSGWVLASDRTAPARLTLVLRGANAFGLESGTGIPRPDVAKALDSPAAATTGFSANATLNNLAPGTYQIMMLVPGPGGNELCDSRRQLAVDP